MTNNKKYLNFIKNIDYYKSLLPKKYKSYFDVVSKLYVDRKIEKKVKCIRFHLN